MSLQILIGSNPEDLANLNTLRALLNWSNTILDESYSVTSSDADDIEIVYPDSIPFSRNELVQLHDWIDGIYQLLTDVSMFADEEVIGTIPDLTV